jgi:hypothetical protein
MQRSFTMATEKFYTSATMEHTPKTTTRTAASTQARPAEESVFSDFSPAQAIRAGLGAGTAMGVIIGGTFWTHSPDIIHLEIALLVLIFCMAAGAGIGKLVSSIKSE